MGGIPQDDIRQAAGRVTRAPAGSQRPRTGRRDRETELSVLRSRVARATVTDPDTVWEYARMAANKASAYGQSAAAGLQTMLLAVEDFMRDEVTPPDTAQLKEIAAQLQDKEVVSSTDIRRLSDAADRVLRKVSKSTTRGSRVARSGPDARGIYNSAREDTLKTWELFRASVEAFVGDRFIDDTVRVEAMRTPIENLQNTVEEMSSERLVDSAIQLAAASAAVEFTGRDCDTKTRFSTSPVFPDGAYIVSSVIDGGVVVELTPSISPVLLGVRTGDIVTAPGASAEVISVTDANIGLRSSTITSTSILRIESAAAVTWAQLVEQINLLFSTLPTTTELQAALSSSELSCTSSAYIRTFMSALAGWLVKIQPLSVDALSALQRVGADAPTSAYNLVALLKSYTPTISASTRDTCRRVIEAAEELSLDEIKELLFAGRIGDVVTLPMTELSKSGKILAARDRLSIFRRAGLNNEVG